MCKLWMQDEMKYTTGDEIRLNLKKHLQSPGPGYARTVKKVRRVWSAGLFHANMCEAEHSNLLGTCDGHGTGCN